MQKKKSNFFSLLAGTDVKVDFFSSFAELH